MAYLGRQPNTGVRSRYIYTATASQTTFSGSDDDGKTLKYEDAAYLDVFLNGVLLKPVTDYTATSKTSVVLTSGAAASDIVEIVAYDIANIANTVSATNGGTFEADVTVQGTVTADGLSVDGGTIKLDGNYPVGSNNVALGNTALDSNVSGGSNTAIGADALTANTASNNTAVGFEALVSNTTASDNTAVGRKAAYSNTTGTYNSFLGTLSGYSNSTGSYNTNLGYAANFGNSTGSYNTAIGFQSLNNNTASNNTAVGYLALNANTTGQYSTAVGYRAGQSNTGGTSAFFGADAGQSTTGANNTFIGTGAGSSVTSGAKNSILGKYNGNQGGLDIRTSSNNIVLSDGDGNPRAFVNSGGSMAVGTTGFDTSNTTGVTQQLYSNGAYITIGGTSGKGNGEGFLNFNRNGSTIGSVSQASTSSVNYNTTSDYRLKENVVDLENATQRLTQLQPKRFEWISDEDGAVWDGFLAHEVQSVVPEAITGTHDEVDDEGSPVYQGIDQSKLVPLLTAALQEAITKIEALETENVAIKARLDALETP